MPYTEVRIGGSVEIGYSQWRKVDLTWTLSEGEDVDAIAKKVGEKVDELLFPAGVTISKPKEVSTKDKSVDDMIKDMESCTSIDKLKEYRFLPAQNERFKEAYEEMYKKLSDGN